MNDENPYEGFQGYRINIDELKGILSDDTDSDDYTNRIMDMYRKTYPSTIYESNSFYDESDVTKEQSVFINTLLKLTKFPLTKSEVNLLKNIDSTGRYDKKEAKKLNRIRESYIAWRKKRK